METLPSPNQLFSLLPVNQQVNSFISSSRNTIRQIVEGSDPRLLLIIGPCSIHDLKSAREYAQKLKKLQEEVSSQFYLVMRTYFEKPRTKLGWKGFVYDPHLDGSHDIRSGLEQSRRFLLELAELEVPAAIEFLDPMIAPYYADLVSWGCIGARTASSQIHRQLASSLNIPMGIKNTTEGNIDIAIQGMISASQPHTFMGLNLDSRPVIINSIGNPDTQLVLRGGERGPNYDEESLANASLKLKRADLGIKYLIDCSHDNSEKVHTNQPGVFQSLIQQYIEGNQAIRGILIESHLFEGTQSMKHPALMAYGVSLTDPCMDWNTTEKLIQWGKQSLTSSETNISSVGKECVLTV